MARFLNEVEGENLAEDGVYDEADVEAVKRFQLKHRRAVLDVWNLTEPTGYVGFTTRLKMNTMLAADSKPYTCPAFTEYNGYNGDEVHVLESPEIARTQQLLFEFDLYDGPYHGIWDDDTEQAMIVFQEMFHEVMLDPWNLSRGTGFKYKTTNKFLNYFVGCDTPEVQLEGIGPFDF